MARTNTTSGNKAIAYLRVSTQKQGRSGLGLEAQQATIEGTCTAYGLEVLNSFVEVESGKKNDRPKLAEALRFCKLSGATLVVAKADRLSRNAGFLYSLMESGVNFFFCDMPMANKAVLGFMFSMAQTEREMISQRTKSALQSAKDRGTKLGNPNGAAAFGENSRKGATEALVAGANDFAADAIEVIRPLQEQGLSLRKIAEALNSQGLHTRRGGQWNSTSVKRVIERMSN